jgi:hypothetical protein
MSAQGRERETRERVAREIHAAYMGWPHEVTSDALWKIRTPREREGFYGAADRILRDVHESGEPVAWLGQVKRDGAWEDDFATYDPAERDEYIEQEEHIRTLPGMVEYQYRVVPLFSAPPATSGEREAYTLDEIDAALYAAHCEWDARNMASFSSLMVKHLLATRTPTKEET